MYALRDGLRFLDELSGECEICLAFWEKRPVIECEVRPPRRMNKVRLRHPWMWIFLFPSVEFP